MERIRADRDATAFVHALGWNCTKHALAVYGGRRPARGWQRAGGEAVQAAASNAQAHPAVADAPAGRGTLETYTVVHGRDGDPERGVAIGLLDDGRRFVAALPKDRTLLAAFERDEQVGRVGTVRTADRVSTFDPA